VTRGAVRYRLCRILGGGSVVFTETNLRGAFIIDLERREDSRGFFARSFCQKELADHGCNPNVVQANVSRSIHRGTIRGMHFQYPPHAEAKMVRATRGAILDVAVDLRPESTTFLQHVAVELSADNGRALYIPERFAHGFQTLEATTDVFYLASASYAPGGDGGLSPFDPRLAIPWPLPVSEVSPKDSGWSPLEAAGTALRARMSPKQHDSGGEV
jgi:dTDP-4-dehydrorhamnose 3,5-epimerase